MIDTLASLTIADILAGVGLGIFSVVGAIFWMAMAAPLPV